MKLEQFSLFLDDRKPWCSPGSLLMPTVSAEVDITVLSSQSLWWPLPNHIQWLALSSPGTLVLLCLQAMAELSLRLCCSGHRIPEFGSGFPQLPLRKVKEGTWSLHFSGTQQETGGTSKRDTEATLMN